MTIASLYGIALSQPKHSPRSQEGVYAALSLSMEPTICNTTTLGTRLL